ncbi:MAG: FHA domain-containing protein [Prevotella sp.]|nr:FHA domain-containing protein [Prevotella sp.]
MELPGVSRYHATFRKDGVYMLPDDSSTALMVGVRINGVSLRLGEYSPLFT